MGIDTGKVVRGPKKQSKGLSIHLYFLCEMLARTVAVREEEGTIQTARLLDGSV